MQVSVHSVHPELTEKSGLIPTLKQPTVRFRCGSFVCGHRHGDRAGLKSWDQSHCRTGNSSPQRCNSSQRPAAMLPAHAVKAGRLDRSLPKSGTSLRGILQKVEDHFGRPLPTSLTETSFHRRFQESRRFHFMARHNSSPQKTSGSPSAYSTCRGDSMSTQALELKYHRRHSNSLDVCLRDAPHTIRASVRVRAETRRLFQALTSPEYLEAWLCVPGSEGRWSLSADQSVSGFLIESGELDSERVRIAAAYTTLRRRRLAIHWKMERNCQRSDSTVTMRLHGDFECSVLSLHHAGLRFVEDADWHRQLWTASLERLARLF